MRGSSIPRGPRLDAPGILRHVIARGIEKAALFRADKDREDIPRRLGGLVEATGTPVLAWALLPDHVYLPVNTRARLPVRRMRSLPIGHAGAFNRTAMSSLGS